MAGSFVVAGAILISVLQVTGGQLSDCQQILLPIGGKATFSYQGRSKVYGHDHSIIKEGNVIIGKIAFWSISISTYEISPEYHDRVSVSGRYDSWSGWNITFTLTNVSNGNEGMYLLQRNDVVKLGCKYLLILEKPAMSSDKLFYNEVGQVIIMEGGYLTVTGHPAEILGNNTRFNVSMNWLINGETLKPDGSFIVLPDRLSIWSFPQSLHGATLTYRATVDGTSVMTEANVSLSVIYVDIHLNISETLFVVNTGELLPAILCEVRTNVKVEEIEYTWIRGDQLITNDTIFSLGYADLTMTGEYRCSVKSTVTGQRKEKGVFISVHEQPRYPEQSQVGIIVLSIITGLIAIAFVAMATFVYRRSRVGHGKNGDSTNEVSMSRSDKTCSDQKEDYAVFDIDMCQVNPSYTSK